MCPTQQRKGSGKHVLIVSVYSVLPPFGKFPSLRHLTLDSLPSVKHADGTSFGRLGSLENFRVSSLTSWIDWSHAEDDHGPLLPHVTRFELHNCPLLKEVPYLLFMSSLSELDISVCGDFVKALPQYVQLLARLKKQSMSYCNHPVPLSGHQLKSLEHLYLRNCGGLRLIDGLHSFPNLREVDVLGCPDIITEFSDRSTGQDDQQGVSHLTSLRTDASLLHGHCFLPSVRVLRISFLVAALQFTPEQEGWFEQLVSIEKLEFDFYSSLQRLPSTLSRLASLKVLKTWGIKFAQPVSLEGVVPANLQELIMDNFETGDNLKPGGSDWSKISHVPYIRLNKKTVQNLSVNAASTSSDRQV